VSNRDVPIATTEHRVALERSSLALIGSLSLHVASPVISRQLSVIRTRGFSRDALTTED